MQAEAHELAALLQSHPHFKHVQHSGSGRGYVVYTESAESGIQDRVPLTGITASLQQTYWPHYRYEARRGTGAGAGAGGAVGAATGRRKIPAPRAYAAITNTAVLVQRLTPLRRSAGVAHVAPLYPAMATAAAAAANASSRGGGVGYNGNGNGDDDDDDGVGVGDENNNNNNNNQRNRKTKRARILDAMDEGHLVHQQVALYTRFLVQDRETCVERFKSVLSISSPPQSVHPATRRIIQSFNEMTPSSSSSSAAATLAPFGGAGAGAGVNGGRFIPVWSEVVVADLPALLRGEKGPWGTAVDLLVLDTYTHSLTVVEIKTTTADFEVGKHRMRYSLSFMDDSPLNQARVQLAVTMELFRRTYRELITDTRPLMGMVLMVTRDGRDYKRYYMDDSDAQHIIRALQRDGWIKPAYA